ncbi:MAG: hypothetical protein WCE68_08710 [Anaerolineales bacterium]
MVDNTNFPYQIVVLTEHYSITGGLFLREQRVSDYLNTKLDSTILLRNSSLAHLEDPAKIIEKMPMSIVPKAGIVLVFEPPQKTTPKGRQFIKYPKQKYGVFLALDGMEVRGKLNVQGPLDLRNTITNLAESFIPITEATVSLLCDPTLFIKREAVLVNAQHIRFLAEMETAVTEEKG